VFALIVRFLTVFVLFRSTGFVRSKFSADSITLASSTLQIRIYDCSEHFNYVISNVGFVIDIRPFYAINSDTVSLFADSFLLVFSEIELVMILIDEFPMNLNK
jgi:hypothetical protein